MQPHIDTAIAALAERQHGVMAWRQLRDLGISRQAVDFRLSRGRLHIVHRGVYAAGHPVLTREGRFLAAVLALGPGAVLSHRSAAVLWGLRRAAGLRIDVTVPGRGTRARRTGITVHRTPEVQVAEHRGIPITTVARTLLDLAAVVGRRELDQAVFRAQELRLFDLRAIESLPMAGRKGSRTLMEVIAAYDDAPTRSELERRFLELCRRHDLPRPQVNVWLAECAMEVDAVWPEQRVVVELDGRAHHGTAVAFERDRDRDARLALAGLRTARFTWRQVTEEPATVAAVVEALLASSGTR